MTVQELKDYLNQFDDDTQVYMDMDDFNARAEDGASIDVVFLNYALEEVATQE